MPSLNYYVKAGDVVALAEMAAVPDSAALLAAAAQINWRSRILFEDAVLLVIDKPAGFASAPANAEPVSALSCMEQALRARDGAAAPKELYPLHRLDKPTSGVLMLAKDPRICAPVSRALRTRGVSKHYWAALDGRLPGDDAGTWPNWEGSTACPPSAAPELNHSASRAAAQSRSRISAL